MLCKRNFLSIHTFANISFNYTIYFIVLYLCNFILSRSQWPRSLRYVVYSTAWTLGSRVRIPLGAFIYVRVFLCCVVLCRQRPCVGLIPRPGCLNRCRNRIISSEVKILNRNSPWMAYSLKEDECINGCRSLKLMFYR